jgi:hypothetical protein
MVRLDRSEQSSCNMIWLKRVRDCNFRFSEASVAVPVVVETAGGFHMRLLHTNDPSSAAPSQHDIERLDMT